MVHSKSSWLVVALLVVGLVSFSFAQQKEKPDKEKGIVEETTWSANFNQESVENVVVKLGKQFNKKVTVTVGVKGTKINLGISKATLDEVLKSLTQPQGWQYIQDGDTIMILTASEWQQEMKKRLVLKTYQIKYAQVQSVFNFIQPFLSTYGKISYDEWSKQILITDFPEVITKIDRVIASLDLPTETRIIPIRYSSPEHILRVLDPLRSLRGAINFDKKTNIVILSDIVSNLQKMETLITQLESEAQSMPQVNIDCSIIKVALNQKYFAGIDWASCPFVAKEMGTQSGVYLKEVDQNKLIQWLGAFGNAELISRKKATVVPGNPVSVREGAQYTIVVSYPTSITQDTTTTTITKQMATSRTTVDSGFTYNFTVQPTIDEKEKVIQLTYKVDGVLPESGNRTTYSVGIDNVRIKDGYTLVTEDIRRLPLGTIAGVLVEEPDKIKYGSMDLILLITPHILTPEAATVK
ncbi:MAG: hypothetical protein QME64_02935 [bacterium]|nr:hypothetical protein [bacterium]